MKNFMMKYGTVLSAVVFAVATHSANRVCWFVLNQPEAPESLKSLRKF